METIPGPPNHPGNLQPDTERRRPFLSFSNKMPETKLVCNQ
jgi:hypothetical protein